MSHVFQKDPNLPWFVVPLIVGAKEHWKDSATAGRESGKVQTILSGKHTTPKAERNLVGYLTFDSPGKNTVPRPPNKAAEADKDSEWAEADHDWTRFQNDLLNQMSLLGACTSKGGALQIDTPPTATARPTARWPNWENRAGRFRTFPPMPMRTPPTRSTAPGTLTLPTATAS